MNENIPERVVVAANFTVEPISKTLTSLLTKITGMHDLVFAPYNQIFGQLLDPASLFHTNRNGVNILFVRLEDLIESRGADIEYIRSKLDEIKSNAADLAKMLGVAERFSVPLFVFLCQASTGIQTDLELTTAFDGVEKVIHETASDFSNLFVFPTDYVASRYEVAAIDNPRANVLGHVPYTDSYMSALAVEAVRKIDAYRRSPLKVLVLDCDNTLWDGVVGEDGVEGIGCSEKRSFLQNFAVKQSESGMVVCLNSKNNEADVWEVFDKRTDMVLKKEHIVSSRINWLPKSENLRSIADELQLALDSFVFVDDDPVVCDEVRRNCPEALTVLLPLGSDDYCKFFEHLWIFDKLKITREDRERTRSYRDQGVRRELQSQAGDMTEFLASLKLVCEISELKSQDIPRVSQLTLRTNQFNSTTLRLSEADVRERISRDNKVVWTVKVSDRFGDYGLVGVVIFEELQRSISVESFMLSCRVLGRGVEHQILKALGKKALVADREFVTLDYAPTAKNAPILNFLTEINEGLETADTGRVIYKVPAIVAVESSPRRAQIQEPSASIVGAELQTGMSSRVSDPDRFQVYIELANELSKSGYLSFNGISADLSRDTLRSEFRRAGTVTERTLTQIWERLLNANNIGIADNFFEIGGDSLVAVTLFLEIEEQFDRRLPISSLLDSPTIEKLARIIDFETDPTAWKYLVPIQVQGTKPPLFCMHAAGGNVLFYRDLATGLGNDQPVYGLQSRGITDKSETAHDSVEDMAAEYLNEICQVMPTGPYFLCGSSFGGLVAFECAKQLLDLGKLVAIVAVFDTYAPEYLNSQSLSQSPFSLIHRSIERIRNTTNHLRDIGSLREQMGFVLDCVGKLKHWQKRKILWKKNEFAILYNKATGRELPDDMSRNHKAIRKAEGDYRPDPYDGRLILIRASDQPKTVVFDPFLGWKRYIKREIVTEEVKGTHGAIAVNPFAADLAARLKNYLNDAAISSPAAPAVSRTQAAA